MGTKRTWAEINLAAIQQNLAAMQGLLPAGSRVMAVVKANAYGHGSTTVAGCLQAAGVQHFAVATLQEGIELRTSGITGEILVLGYTAPSLAKQLIQYRLTQTAVDAEHALALAQVGRGLPVQLKVDTGMHRLGTLHTQQQALKGLYNNPGLSVKGIYTHFCVADSLEKQDVDFTHLQTQRFNNLLAGLKNEGIFVGKTHLQSSYGVLNYPDAAGDFARLGITLFGVLSQHGKTLLTPRLTPALALKTRVSSVRTLPAGETVGYARAFCCQTPQTVATLCIGYADGLPRNLTNGYVLLHGQKAPIVGRVCMDQTSVLVTGIPGVKAGDTATIIGTDGNHTIMAQDIAQWAGSITNEVLARLGERVERQYY
ncbi:serine racemase VanT catalytic subunit [Ruminococcaceae bacterium OttesenSCG-928-A16]|nr:serine racemase VanT catalytic subunit [Ruminococcaceae bacterium OttesenSCG-928-A16]